MATFAEALLVNCPECDAPKGQLCTYILQTERLINPSWWRNGEQKRYEVRYVGQSTSRPHNARFNKAHMRFHRYRPAPQPLRVPTPRRLAIARAENQFERIEQNKVFAWLLAYGSILQQEESDDGT